MSKKKPDFTNVIRDAIMSTLLDPTVTGTDKAKMVQAAAKIIEAENKGNIGRPRDGQFFSRNK